MTDNQRFSHLLAEFRRVGVDPDTFSAMLSITPDDALAILGSLEDDSGPGAFLAALRMQREARGERLSPPRGVAVQSHERSA